VLINHESRIGPTRLRKPHESALYKYSRLHIDNCKEKRTKKRSSLRVLVVTSASSHLLIVKW
jgi:hypothetical protein